MSILNRPSDGDHSLLVAIAKLLWSEGPMGKDRVIRLVCPESTLLREDNVATTRQTGESIDSSSARNTLRRWTQIGVFLEEGDQVGLHPEIRLPRATPEAEMSSLDLARVARRFVLDPTISRGIWGDGPCDDFLRGICWLLAQEVYTKEHLSLEYVQATTQRQVPSQHGNLIQNDTRWSGLKAWAGFLGFGWSTRFPAKGTFMIDPTVAVRDALADIFGDQQTVSADAFLRRLAETVPVLDGGRYRLEMEKALREQQGPEAWIPPPEFQLSTSLSRALMRLLNDGSLTAQNKADAPKRARLTGRGGVVIVEFSEFTLIPTRRNA